MALQIKRYNNDQWGVFCHVKLESGELIRIMVFYGPVYRLGMHLPSAPVGLLVDTLRWGGLRKGYDIFCFDLRPEDHAVRFAQLPLVQRSDTQVSPLDTMIDYLKDCRNVVEVKQRCDELLLIPLPDDWKE